MGHDEYPVGKFRAENLYATDIIEFEPIADNTPTLTLSGGLFVSGGELWYKGYGDTMSRLAVS